MKRDFIDMMACPRCGQAIFDIESRDERDAADSGMEIRDGSATCQACGQAYAIADGVVDLLFDPSTDVVSQQEITIHADEHSDHEGSGFAINPENIERYREQFLALPEGDGSELYTHGAFKNISGLAAQYYEFVGHLGLTGGESVLEIGADSCWSVAKFARKGCNCVALDINHHLIVSDLFMQEYGVYFERVVADMNRLPFQDDSFDVVFCSQVLHHSTDLRGTMKEIARVLKPGGRLALFSEPMFGLLFSWRKLLYGREARKLGIEERIYSIGEWLGAMRDAGLSPQLRFTIHQRYRRFDKYLAVFRNEQVKRMLTRSRLYPVLLLEPYKADIIARN